MYSFSYMIMLSMIIYYFIHIKKEIIIAIYIGLINMEFYQNSNNGTNGKILMNYIFRTLSSLKKHKMFIMMKIISNMTKFLLI